MARYKIKSDLKNFLKGFLSIFNIQGEHIFIEYSDKSPMQLDYEAILSDWEAVGNDLREAYISMLKTNLNNNVIAKEQLEQLLNKLTDILNEQEEKEKQAKGKFRNYKSLTAQAISSN